MVINRQNKIRVELAAIRGFVGRLRKGLRLGPGKFNICLVDDREMARLNAVHRGKARPTDVLSFPWHPGDGDERGAAHGRRVRAKKAGPPEVGREGREFAHFLGDIVISTETARRNARSEGQSVAREIRWLVLHGVLHLMGYDHETDSGEMTRLELSLRERLKI